MLARLMLHYKCRSLRKIQMDSYQKALRRYPIARAWDKLPEHKKRAPQIGMGGLPKTVTASPELAAALDATTGLKA